VARPRQWHLNPASLERLLGRLDPDPASAGEAYEHLRRALLGFFRWHGDQEPDVAADETLDRLARRLESGESIDDVPAFARGVARFVWLERRRMATAAPVVFDEDLANRIPAVVTDEDDSVLETCLQKCLASLAANDRELIVQYYTSDGRQKIEQRARLARTLGLSQNALRHRAHRLRVELKACTMRCADSRTTGSLHGTNRQISTVESKD
jgi:DNA-directed RNA polymerase specialized sigma24 family protein